MDEIELGMLMKHRLHIEENVEELIKYSDYTLLITELVRRGLLSYTMRTNIENAAYNLNKTDDELLYDQHKLLFRKITKRGPTAYNELIAAMKELEYFTAIRILESVDDTGSKFISINQRKNELHNLPQTSSQNVKPNFVERKETKQYNDVDSPLTPYTEPTPNETRVVLESNKIYNDNILETYPMHSKDNRGVLLMVNIIDFKKDKETHDERRRNGAERDGDSLIHVFRQCGFTIFAYNNLTEEEFFTTLRKLTASVYVRNTECFVMSLMTHGIRVNGSDKVEFRDGAVADVNKILKQFQPDLCPHLFGKPKVLLFPFCRGEGADRGVYIPRIETDGYSKSVATLSDLLVCYASTPGFETHRDPDSGSWYIQAFCDIMAEHAHDTSLEDMLKKTQAMVGRRRSHKGNMQTGAYDNIGFNKKLYFNPGFYQE